MPVIIQLPMSLCSNLIERCLQIEQRGGKCIPVVCDHTNDEDIQRLFDRVKTEQSGQLDVLVNNAYSAVTVSKETNFAS